MQSYLLDGLIGEDEDDDVDRPGNHEERKACGVVDVVITNNSQAEDRLQNQDSWNRDGICEGQTIGSLEKTINEKSVRDVIEDEGSEQHQRPVVTGEAGWRSPKVELTDNPSDGADDDLRGEGQNETVDCGAATRGKMKMKRDGRLVGVDDGGQGSRCGG